MDISPVNNLIIMFPFLNKNLIISGIIRECHLYSKQTFVFENILILYAFLCISLKHMKSTSLLISEWQMSLYIQSHFAAKHTYLGLTYEKIIGLLCKWALANSGHHSDQRPAMPRIGYQGVVSAFGHCVSSPNSYHSHKWFTGLIRDRYHNQLLMTR